MKRLWPSLMGVALMVFVAGCSTDTPTQPPDIGIQAHVVDFDPDDPGSHTIMRPSLDLDPDELNLRSRGKWVTAYLTFNSRGMAIAIYTSVCRQLQLQLIGIGFGSHTQPQILPVSCDRPVESAITDRTVMLKYSRSQVQAQLRGFGPSLTSATYRVRGPAVVSGSNTISVIQ